MKNLVFLFFVIFSTANVFSQSNLNFNTLGGFDYFDITNKGVKLEDILKGKNVGPVFNSNGFNLYEISFSKNTLTHNYITMETGTQDRKEVVYKITNLVDGTNFTKFDVVTEDFGVMTFVVNKDKTTNRDLLVQFKEKNKTYVAVVNM
jgi:hypothetical protein